MTPEEIAEEIRRRIRADVYRPGDALIQENLAEAFNVSRSPLREALRIVAGEGLIVMNRSQGAVVARLRGDELRELYGLRLQLEPALAAAIVASCSDRALERFADMAESMERVAERDAVQWSSINYEFHRSMYEMVDRPHTLRIITQVLSLVEQYSRRYVFGLHALDRVHREHADMIDALRDKDAGRLADAITRHMEGARDSLLKEVRDRRTPP
jgi:DNA-binding GntR family transcriptional regulator